MNQRNPMGQSAPRFPNQTGLAAFCPPPAVRPMDGDNHASYETGKGTGETQRWQLPTQAWESLAPVSLQPCWLMLMEIVFLQTIATPLYGLIFDLTMNNPDQAALIDDGAIARWTLGPVAASSGGTVFLHPTSEHIRDDVRNGPNETSIGIPFNFGLTVVLSSTPRVLTRPVLQDIPVDGMAVTARFKV